NHQRPLLEKVQISQFSDIESTGDCSDGQFPQADIDLAREDNKIVPSQTLFPSKSTNIPISASRDNTMPSPPKKRPLERLPEWVEGSVKLKPNKSIELEDGDFIRIKSIHKDIET